VLSPLPWRMRTLSSFVMVVVVYSTTLLALLSWQMLWEEEGDRRLLPMTDKSVVENFGEAEKQFRFYKAPNLKSAPLNRDHTHFLLIDDNTEGVFGGETAVRMAFEMSLQTQMGRSSENAEICKVLQEKQIGWQGARLPKRAAVDSDADDDSSEAQRHISAVCVCVQGGATTIEKVLEAVKNGTPVLLVKGSGKAADLLSDAMICYQHMNKGGGANQNGVFERTGSESSASTWNDALSEGTSASSNRGFSSEVMMLMQRLMLNDPDDEWLQSEIQKHYRVEFKSDFDKVAKLIEGICKAGLCEIGEPRVFAA
jgi:hypothetical protein